MSKSGLLHKLLSENSGRLSCLALVLAVCATYAGIYPNAFILDDQALIITNVYLQSWRHIPDIFTHLNYDGTGLHIGFYRPVPMLLHLVVFQMFGLSTAAFHTLNIALQAVNALLVQRLGKKLGFGVAASFAAALLWSLHPLHIEAVTYMAATPEILWATFTLLSLIVLLPDFTPRKMIIALILFFLALGCKEAAVVLPALAVVCLFVVSKNKLRLQTYLKTWPFWIIPAVYVSLYFWLNTFRQYAVQDEVSADYAAHILTRIFTSLATVS